MIFAASGPVSRCFYGTIEQWVAWPGVLTWASFDYFGIGALLALAVHRGMSLESPALRWISGIALTGYLAIFMGNAMGWPTYGIRFFQQTLLSIALCGVIAAGSTGFSGIVGKVLEHRFFQRVGQISYGIYLFHNLAPLVAGKLLWFLWDERFDTTFVTLLKIGLYAVVTWLLALASWRWIEQPLQEVRSKLDLTKDK